MDNNGKYGYMIMEHNYPYDNEIYECNTPQEADDILRLIHEQNKCRKVYIREITEAEFCREAMLRASRM